MAVPITHYINVVLALATAGAPQAGFGTPLFLNDNAVTADVLQGPFTNIAEVEAYGFAIGSPFHNWASAVVAQQPRASKFYSGILAGGDVAASLSAIEAVNAGAWYATDCESRDEADILAMAGWTEPRRKIAVAQSATAGSTVGDSMFAAQYTRTALIYHPTDTVHLAGAWLGRCLGFNLDQRKGVWSSKVLQGIAAPELTPTLATAIRARNANYFAPAVSSAGVTSQAFTAQGWMPFGTAGAGRRIDVTTTLDWLHARLEEAGLSVQLRETHGVAYDNAGINRFATAFSNVFNQGVAAGHLARFQVPEGQPYEGELTPAVFAPTLGETTTTERETRELSISALAYLKSSIEKVNFSADLSQ